MSSTSLGCCAIKPVMSALRLTHSETSPSSYIWVLTYLQINCQNIITIIFNLKHLDIMYPPTLMNRHSSGTEQ